MDLHDQLDLPGPGPRQSRGPLVVGILALPLVGVITYLMVLFHPFASAAGGCGGG
jgi:hypothetical protein